jgi:NTP pyrophosphatase (non-canonical NTP hydrolase)
MTTFQYCIGEQNYRIAQLNLWQKFFEEIYSERNKKLNRGIIISHLTRDAGAISKAIRQGDLCTVEKYVSSVFAWLCAYGSCGVASNIEEAIWRKYPTVCFYCESQEDCVCLPWTLKKYKEQDMETRLRAYYQRRRPETLDGWVRMLHHIYGKRNRQLESLEAMCMHLQEEISELVDGEYGGFVTYGKVVYKETDYRQLELADSLGWLFAILHKLNDLTAFAEPYIIPELRTKDPDEMMIRLSDIVWKKYKDGCPTCLEERLLQNKKECICEVIKPPYMP